MNRVRRPVWRSRLLHTIDNLALRAWLADRGSLTARIQTKGQFAVRVLRQGLGQPTPDEAAALDIDPGELVWVREVALSCDRVIVVFAHTVLPRRPRGPLSVWLARLGNRSLGALLFAHAGFVRGPIHFRRLDRRDGLFAAAHRTLAVDGEAPRALWARRSLFAFGPQKVLVTEVFSPRIAQR